MGQVVAKHPKGSSQVPWDANAPLTPREPGWVKVDTS